MVHDAPLFMYMAFGMSRFGYTPYVDFFDMNAPGAHYSYLLVGSVFGYGDLGFRLADLTMLVLLGILTWLIMRRFGRCAAWCGLILFGLLYLGAGSRVSLQRELIALVPIAAAVLVATSLRRHRGAPGWLLVGLLFGLAATVKPAMLVGFPAVVGMGMWEGRALSRRERRPVSPFRLLSLSVLGVLVPIVAIGLHLVRIGALPHFVSIVRGYWPLYTELSRTHVAMVGSERVAYLAGEWLRLGGYGIWLLPAAAGAFAVLSRSSPDPAGRRHAMLLVALAVCYSFYPVIGGKFWSYHWLPFSYFVVLTASLALVEITKRSGLRWLPISALVLAAILGVRPPPEIRSKLTGEEWLHPKVRRADRIAAYLRETVRPGDTVQPLDWTGGAVHAMLMAEAPLATPFIYDFHFCHHVSTDYIQGLRSRFLDAMRAEPPRFVIKVETMRPRVSGPDTERRFRELDTFVAEEYSEAHAGFGYRVYEYRKAGGRAPSRSDSP
jgi:hypothetical protein